MDMCTIAEAIDKEADIAAAASEIMWVIEMLKPPAMLGRIE